MGHSTLRRLALVSLLAWTIGACQPPPSSTPAPAAGPTHCHYDVTLSNADSGQLEVDVRCRGGEVRTFVANERTIADLISAQHPSVGEVTRRGNRFELPSASQGELHYRLNLDAAADRAGDIDVAQKSGAAWIAAFSTWVLQPEPSRPDTRVTVAVTTPDGGAFASGMRRDENGHYTVLARRIHAATYGIFGAFQQTALELPAPLSLMTGNNGSNTHASKTSLKLVVMPGQLALSDEELQRWLRDAALAVGTFWGGFPVEDACVVVIPRPGYSRVVRGKVVSAGGPTVVLQVGSELEAAFMYDDWIAVHEFFHLGFPTFPHTSKWLDEGLATYYEPIIRTRAGWRAEEDLWQEFADDMPQGLPAMEQRGLDNSEDYRDIYWGGAALAFVADVRIRQRTQQKFGLEDGLRAVLAKGGHAGTLWTIDEVVAVVDETIGAPVLSEVVATHRKQGSPVGFEGLLHDLGVDRGADGVLLNDGATLAPIRRLILVPTP